MGVDVLTKCIHLENEDKETAQVMITADCRIRQENN